MKQTVLREVIENYIFPNVVSSSAFQLAKYQTADRESSPSLQPASSVNPQPLQRPSASDILGIANLNLSSDGHNQRSLAVEVEMYINDPNKGTSTLDFWQVGGLVFS
jgi:hypothetical protein